MRVEELQFFSFFLLLFNVFASHSATSIDINILWFFICRTWIFILILHFFIFIPVLLPVLIFSSSLILSFRLVRSFLSLYFFSSRAKMHNSLHFQIEMNFATCWMLNLMNFHLSHTPGDLFVPYHLKLCLEIACSILQLLSSATMSHFYQ